MPAAALALALSAAVVHATWNLLLARSSDPESAGAVVLVTCALVGAPAAAIWWGLESSVWPFVVASVALEVVYFLMLANAYRRAALSVVYPVARGLAPVLVLVGSVALAGAATSAAQVAGVLLVGGGVLLVRGVRRGDRAGLLFGLAIACCIATYTVIDKHGVARATPLTYLELVTLGMVLGYVPVVLVSRGLASVRQQIGWQTTLAGVATFGGYALVLAALRLAPAASVAAVRESSVLVATALASLVLKERVTTMRIAGAVLVVAGVALISL